MDSLVAPTQRITPLFSLQSVMVGLCMALIALQLADGVSTHMALSTGLAEEQNQLLVSLASVSGLSIMTTVWLAKMLTAGFFVLAVLKTKASRLIVSLLALQVVYMAYTVGMNLYWAHHLG